MWKSLKEVWPKAFLTTTFLLIAYGFLWREDDVKRRKKTEIRCKKLYYRTNYKCRWWHGNVKGGERLEWNLRTE